jgi:AraC family transcriptional activator of tynA and feaB
MDKVLAIADFKPRERLAYWYDVACKVLVKHECQVHRESDFDATLLHSSLGELDIVSLESQGIHFAEVTTRTIADEMDDVFFLVLAIEGNATLSQGGRDAVLAPGDFTLIDTRRPYECRYYSDRWKHVIVKIPRPAFNSRLVATEKLTGRTVSASAGVGSLVSGYIQLLPEHILALQPAAKTQVGEHLVDLAALAVAANAGVDAPAVSSGRAVALFRVRMAIESHLSDPTLDPEAVASAAGVSVRYANGLLAEQGMSLERLIVSRRLERCRRALEDPTQRQRTISEIAYAWGFSDLSHFDRRFKAAYGLSPGCHRRSFSD